jgi:hypothetical protein
MKIPSSFMQTDVIVALAIAMPAGQNGNGITFPLIEGRIAELHDDCVVLLTSKGDTMCIPDTRIQHVIKASKIARPDTGLVDANGERV